MAGRPSGIKGELTKRETEVLELVGKGLSNKQIARRLHISLYTVKNHLHEILGKTGAETREGAAEAMLGQGWLQLQWENRCSGCPVRKMLVSLAEKLETLSCEVVRDVKYLFSEEECNERSKAMVVDDCGCSSSAAGSEQDGGCRDDLQD